MRTTSGATLAKVWGRDAEHVSRWRTRGGALPGAGEFLRLPGMLVRRLLPRETPGEPWMAPGAVRSLDRLLTPAASVLELGAGDSTAWYAARAGRVVSVEPNPEWADRVATRLADVPNAELRRTSVAACLEIELKAAPDVLVVDHLDEREMSRVDAVAAALAAPAQPGTIVLDDSDRRRYSPVFRLLRGWEVQRHRGFRPSPLRVTETTIFRRPEPS